MICRFWIKKLFQIFVFLIKFFFNPIFRISVLIQLFATLVKTHTKMYVTVFYFDIVKIFASLRNKYYTSTSKNSHSKKFSQGSFNMENSTHK